MNTEYRRSRPSFFFPIALITAGVIWLLVNNGMIAESNLYRLLPLWPVLLIAAGLGIMLHRIWWPLSGLLWAGLAFVLVWALVFSPTLLPAVGAREVQHQTLQEPLGAAKSATVRLDLSINSTNIHALQDAINLVSADVYSAGKVNLNSSGSEARNVTLHGNLDNFNFFNFDWVGQASTTWDIGLAPSVPMDLRVDAATGSTNMDLTGLKLTGLVVNAATGSTEIRLPQGVENLPFTLDMGTGSADVTIPDGSSVILNSSGGTGSLDIKIPAGAGVQVVVRDGGLGSLHLPDGVNKVSGDAGDKEGTYENSAFAGAKSPIRIRLDIGTGSVSIR